jgi:hypothetical protein
LKTPTNALGYFGGVVKFREVYKIPNSKLMELKKSQEQLMLCKDKLNKEEEKKVVSEVRSKNMS